MINNKSTLQRSSVSAPIPEGLSRRSLLKYLGVGTAAVAATPLLAACSGGGDGAQAGGMQDFAVAAFPGDAYFLDTINLANKDYANHGLKVDKHLTPQNGVQAFQLLTAGAIDGYAADTLLLMATHANSTKGKRPLLIGFRMTETTYGIVGGPKHQWPSADASFEEKMASLKGKRVGVTSIGAGGDLQLKLALELAGMKYGDVTALAVGPTAQAIPNIKADRIDAYVTVQWTSTRYVAQESGGSVLIDFAEPNVPDTLRNQAVVAIGMREESIQKDPELAKKWLATQNDARNWIKENPEDAAKLLNESGLGGKGAEIAKNYVDHYIKDIDPKLNEMFKADKATVDHMAELALRFGSVKEGQITFESLVPEFARA